MMNPTGDNESKETHTMKNKDAHKLNDEKDPDDDDQMPWLQVGLFVKVQNKTLASGAYYGAQGVVKETVNGMYAGKVMIIGKGDILLLDQDECRTVVPAAGKCALVIGGGVYEGCKCMVVRREDGPGGGVEVEILEGQWAGHSVQLPSSQVCQHLAIK